MIKRDLCTVRQHAIALLIGGLLSASSYTAAAYQHPYSLVDSDAPAATAPAAVAPEGAVEIATASTAATRSSGCGKEPPHTGNFSMNTVDGNKKTRNYSMVLPGNYNGAYAYAVVFVFHGAGGSPAQSYSWGLQNTPGAPTGAIFVFPAGIQFENYGIGWDDSKNGYDMPFFDNMLKAVEADFCINTNRVFAAGFSWGGDFVVALSCARGSVLRAVAANSTTDEYTTATESSTYENLPCPSATHPPVRFEHAQNGDSEYPAPLFATTSSLYRSFNVCSTTSKTVASSFSGMNCVSYNSCAKEFIECTFPSSIGHALPPNWAKDTWAFFSTFT